MRLGVHVGVRRGELGADLVERERERGKGGWVGRGLVGQRVSNGGLRFRLDPPSSTPHIHIHTQTYKLLEALDLLLAAVSDLIWLG